MIRILTTRKRARRHAGHIMSAIHVIRGGSGRLSVMMRRNRTVIRSAARGVVRRPEGSRERRMKHDDRKQTNTRKQRTPAILVASGHAIPNLA